MTSTISEPDVRRGVAERTRDAPPGLAKTNGTPARARARAGGGRRPAPAAADVPLLRRPRVEALLSQAAAHRVSLVCAPAGAGKSIACAQWAGASVPEGSLAWLDLDPGDRRPGQFWSHLRSVFAATPAVPGEVISALPDPGDDAFPHGLVEAAGRLTSPVTLVIDDIHEIAGAPVLPGFDHLVRHGPPELRLVLIGRHHAGIAVARLRVGGELAEIGAGDLACAAAEADDYFAMLGLDLSPAHRDELLDRTLGWITGLRLAVIGSASAPLSGADPAVADYLRDEVLAPVAGPDRLFLTRTSVADVICGDLADAVTAGNRSGGAARLERLARENLMILPADDAGPAPDPGDAWYRYHPLLLDLLRADLRREFPAEAAPLARRAAKWQAGRGAAVPAIRTAALAGDWDLAARVLAGAGPVLLLPGPAAELEPVLARFPASRYVNDAAVAGALAAAGLRTGDPSAAALHIGNAERALHRCPPAHRGAVETWLQALRLMNADPDARDLAEQSRAIAQAAESQAPSAGSQQALGLLWSALGVSALAQMDVRQATAAFASAAGYLRDGAHREFGAQVRGWQALAEALAGNLSAAWDLASQDANAGDPLAAALADLALAHVHWARDEAAAGLQALDRHDTGGQARPGGHLAAGRVLSVQATSARARLALGDGDQAAAGAALARLRYQCAQAGGAALNLALASVDADVALSEGDVRRARTMVARACAEGGGTRPDVRLAGARVALADGDCPAVLSALDPYLAAAGPLYDQVCALIMAAVCERRLGQADQAAAHLGLALALAEPHRLYRPFLDGGAAARSALTVLISPVSQGAAFAARILQRFDADPARPGRQSDAVRLTSSELAVLRFLPTHMTNQEIAESLYLSVNTVKTHLRSVYRKFGVTTRRQAISRGGRLGLL